MVNQLIEIIKSAWFAILLTLIGIFLTILYYRWSKREKRPRYLRRSVVIVRNAKKTIPALTVHHRGHSADIDNLSATVFWFWNEGAETIHGNDIAQADQLRIIASKDVKILGASVLGTNNFASTPNIDYQKTENQVLLTFDYLDRNQGVAIEVLHTGTSGQAVAMRGTIKGGGPVVEQGSGSGAVGVKAMPMRRSTFFAFLVSIVIGFGSLSWITYVIIMEEPKRAVVLVDGKYYVETQNTQVVNDEDGKLVVRQGKKVLIPIVLFTMCPSIAVGYVLYQQRKDGVPKGLEQYGDYI